MFPPEYRIGFRILSKEIGLGSTLRVVVPSVLRSLPIRYQADGDARAEVTKARIKNHFKLLGLMVQELKRRYGTPRTNEVMRLVLMGGGQVFFRGFTPLGPGDDLRTFAAVYKDFESQNIVFDVIEESDKRFEIVVRRCLVYEAFQELGMVDQTQCMCDVAFEYFSSYHPRMRYAKDRMIARGDEMCHEVFSWE